MIHDTCIFIKYQTGAIGDHFLKQWRDLSKTIQFFKGIFTTVVQNSSSEWLLGFTAYDTR